jgi:hypothetical protein
MADDGYQALSEDGAGPFVLLGGGDAALLVPGALEAALRRMGLEPVAVTPPRDATPEYDGGCFDIRLGAQRACIGLAAGSLVDESRCHPETLWAGTGAAPPGEAASATLMCRPQWGQQADRIAVSREFCKLAVLLVDLLGARHIYWSPARLWSEAAAFRAAVAEMLVSGMPPLLHLLAFQDMPGGGIATRGLSFFAGQELHLVDGAGLDRKDAVRRLARLALDIMVHGPITAPRRFRGLTEGETLRVGPATGADGAGILIVTILRE